MTQRITYTLSDGTSHEIPHRAFFDARRLSLTSASKTAGVFVGGKLVRAYVDGRLVTVKETVSRPHDGWCGRVIHGSGACTCLVSEK